MEAVGKTGEVTCVGLGASGAQAVISMKAISDVKIIRDRLISPPWGCENNSWLTLSLHPNQIPLH